MPADRTELVERYLRGETDVVEPRDAASVVLLRDGAAGLDVYLLRRRPTMAFAAGMHVYPGGSVDPRDREAAEHWAGPPPAEWAEAFSCDAVLAVALVSAAVRETFEESGVLLAAHQDGTLVTDTTGEDWERDRLALIEGTLALSDFLERRSLLLRADLLRPWAHWVTPEWQTRRFDTRFFLAALPSGQRTRDVGGEADRVTWLPVTEAYRGFRDASLTMMNATASTLRDLTAHPDVASAMAGSRRIRPILGRPVLIDGRLDYLYDGDDGPAPLAELVEPFAASDADPGGDT
ncbi:NUDIX hydrolase [Blastococcus saxobsidens]|uniref:Putative NUDIX family protein n=1 Tax=Blastococcus saxobsidens (strain DD2) TaxID=1146883 RepID=H6RT39_BLASD|nr:putative NUDIX family protein [Blastococcus saxobsidens]CCG04342.1 Putative NUDIX family protein [Blastococcus saxobsidens DD2]